MGSSGGKANCKVWAGKTQNENFLFGNNCKIMKSCKDEKRTRNTSILFSQIQLLLTCYPLLNHT